MCFVTPSIVFFFIAQREDKKVCLSSWSLQFYAFKSSFEFIFSKSNQAMLPYELERALMVWRWRRWIDDGMGFKLADPKEEEDDFSCEPVQLVLPKFQQKKPMANSWELTDASVLIFDVERPQLQTCNVFLKYRLASSLLYFFSFVGHLIWKSET